MCETFRRFGEFLIALARQGYGADSSFHDTFAGRRSGSGAASDSSEGLCRNATEGTATRGPITPEFVLIFDAETTPDETQQLRFGTYQLLHKGKVREKGLFYGKVTPAELETLKAEAPKHGCVEPLEPS